MKKKTTRLFALVLVLSLALSMTACKEVDPNSTSTPGLSVGDVDFSIYPENFDEWTMLHMKRYLEATEVFTNADWLIEITAGDLGAMKVTAGYMYSDFVTSDVFDFVFFFSPHSGPIVTEQKEYAQEHKLLGGTTNPIPLDAMIGNFAFQYETGIDAGHKAKIINAIHLLEQQYKITADYISENATPAPKPTEPDPTEPDPTEPSSPIEGYPAKFEDWNLDHLKQYLADCGLMTNTEWFADFKPQDLAAMNVSGGTMYMNFETSDPFDMLFYFDPNGDENIQNQKEIARTERKVPVDIAVDAMLGNFAITYQFNADATRKATFVQVLTELAEKYGITPDYITDGNPAPAVPDIGVDMSQYPASFADWTIEHFKAYLVATGAMTEPTWFLELSAKDTDAMNVSAAFMYMNFETGDPFDMVYYFAADGGDKVQTQKESTRTDKIIPNDMPVDAMIGNFALTYQTSTDANHKAVIIEALRKLETYFGITADYIGDGNPPAAAPDPGTVDMSQYPASFEDWSLDHFKSYMAAKGAWSEPTWFLDMSAKDTDAMNVSAGVMYMNFETGNPFYVVVYFAPDGGDKIAAQKESLKTSKMIPGDIPADTMIGNFAISYQMTTDEAHKEAFKQAIADLVAYFNITPDF